MTDRKVPVSQSALLQRINRKLAKHSMMLKKSRSQRARLDLGEFYVLDCNRNVVLATHIDVEEQAAEEGVLQAWEALADSEAVAVK